MEESRGKRGCKVFKSNMQGYDELSSYRSMNFGTDSPAQFAVLERVFPTCIWDGKHLDSGRRNAGCLP